MKGCNFLQFLGCCVISIGLIAAGWLISEGLPDTTRVPANLSVITKTVDEEIGDYLSMPEIAAYFGVTREDVEKLFNSGELEGTYIKVGANLVFSRQKLDEWVERRMG